MMVVFQVAPCSPIGRWVVLLKFYICHTAFFVVRRHWNLLHCRRRSTSAPFGRCGSYGEANAVKAAVVSVTRSGSHALSPGVAWTKTRRGNKISSLADFESYKKIYILCPTHSQSFSAGLKIESQKLTTSSVCCNNIALWVTYWYLHIIINTRAQCTRRQRSSSKFVAETC